MSKSRTKGNSQELTAVNQSEEIASNAQDERLLRLKLQQLIMLHQTPQHDYT